MLIGLDSVCHLNDSFVFAREPSSYISQVMGEFRLRNARGFWERKKNPRWPCGVAFLSLGDPDPSWGLTVVFH